MIPFLDLHGICRGCFLLHRQKLFRREKRRIGVIWPDKVQPLPAFLMPGNGDYFRGMGEGTAKMHPLWPIGRKRPEYPSVSAHYRLYKSKVVCATYTSFYMKY